MRETLVGNRPAIPNGMIEENTTTEEAFQNKTLRPILKLQNNLFLAIFESYLIKFRIKFEEFSIAKKKAIITKSILNDQNLRNIYIGTVIGHFTMEEWHTYSHNEKAFNKRIIKLLIQRLQDQLTEEVSNNIL